MKITKRQRRPLEPIDDALFQTVTAIHMRQLVIGAATTVVTTTTVIDEKGRSRTTTTTSSD